MDAAKIKDQPAYPTKAVNVSKTHGKSARGEDHLLLALIFARFFAEDQDEDGCADIDD